MLQFLRFGAVGTVGFLVDGGVLHAALGLLGLDLYSGRVVSYLCAATTTWALNRHYTFGAASTHPAARQWAKFLVVNIGGGGINYGVYALLVATFPLFAATPVLAVAAGSLAGLCVNFFASKKFVFSPA